MMRRRVWPLAPMALLAPANAAAADGAGISFDALVWLVARGALATTAVFFAAGKMWRHEYSQPPLTRIGRVRKTLFGVLMGAALFVLLGAFTLMKPPTTIDWVKDEAAAFARARAENKVVFIDFWANWCQRCNEIERESFGREELHAALVPYVPLKVDATDPDEETDEMMRKYGVGELPTFILASADGERRKVLDATYLGKGDQTELIVGELGAFARGVDTGTKKGRFREALDEGLLWALLAAFLGGLVTALTPCVYPMIPITVAIIGGSAQGSKATAFRNSIIYVGGMALCYSTLGVTVAAVGGQFAALFQNRWFLIAVAGLFLLLAAHMLEIRKLGFLMTLQNKAGSSNQRKGLVGIFIMGVLAGFVFSPCVGPVLIGVLTYIGESGDIPLGFVFMFTFAVGMGLPFILLGTFSGLLGRIRGTAGDWMIGVEATFGAALIAAALYFLVPVVPALNVVFDRLGALAG